MKLADELDDLKKIAELLAARDFVNAREKVVAVTMGSPVIDEESKKQRANATPA
jgi:hypothetical protein